MEITQQSLQQPETAHRSNSSSSRRQMRKIWKRANLQVVIFSARRWCAKGWNCSMAILVVPSCRSMMR